MRKVVLSLSLVCACSVGVAKAFYDVTQPVGHVTEKFCKNPQKPCSAYSFEVKDATVSLAARS